MGYRIKIGEKVHEGKARSNVVTERQMMKVEVNKVTDE